MSTEGQPTQAVWIRQTWSFAAGLSTFAEEPQSCFKVTVNGIELPAAVSFDGSEVVLRLAPGNVGFVSDPRPPARQPPPSLVNSLIRQQFGAGHNQVAGSWLPNALGSLNKVAAGKPAKRAKR